MLLKIKHLKHLKLKDIMELSQFLFVFIKIVMLRFRFIRKSMIVLQNIQKKYLIGMQQFKEYLEHIVAYNKELDTWEKLIGCDIFEAKIFSQASNVSNDLVTLLGKNNNELIDLINWWLYEDVDKILWLNGEEISVRTIDEFCKYINENYYDNKGN